MADDTRDYQRLLLDGVPLLDVRAPVEFTRGAFPTAENLPILDDEERRQVGIRYKEAGQQAAIELGQRLVSGAEKERRIRAWTDFARRHPDGYLYCFRGGLRSRTAREWMREAGMDFPLVEGGYKAMRRFLLDRFEQEIPQTPLQLLSGRTGTGKTRVIERLDDAIDLEGLAHHRGSAFGRRPGGQPAQIDFENRLYIALLKQRARHCRPLVVEDESRLIGRCHLPLSLQARMKESPRVVIEESLESRVRVTLEDYVIAPLNEYRQCYGDARALQRLGEELLAAMDRIRKRLGGVRHRQLRGALEDALALQRQSGDTDAHRAWIRELLAGYYDPMYDYMFEKRGGRILFTGTRAEVLDWLREQCTVTTEP